MALAANYCTHAANDPCQWPTCDCTVKTACPGLESLCAVVFCSCTHPSDYSEKETAAMRCSQCGHLI